MSSSVEKVITHYQRDIEKLSSKPERALKHQDRILHCLNKLSNLPVTVAHLQSTGVGRTVNSLRKLTLQNGANDAAKALVAKWKNMAIEEDDEEENQQHETDHSNRDDSHEVDYTPSFSQPSRNSYSPESLSQSSELKEYSPAKKQHKPNGYNPSSPSHKSIAVYCYSPNKVTDKKEHDSRVSKSSREKKTESDRPSNEKSSHRKSGSSKSREQSSSSKSRSSSHRSSSTSSGSKRKREEEEEEEDGDSETTSGGASFAQALGPIVVKKSSSSKKKSSSSDAGSSLKNSTSSSSKTRPETNPKPSDTKTAPASQLLDDVAGPSHLSPLDLDMVSNLSTPTPNYRPIPQPSLSIFERRQLAREEEDALDKMMSNRNKNVRTKVYSGVKGGYSYVPSLYEICCNVLKQHIDALEFTGGIPYSLLKPVLDSATPSQLYQFEHFNPYIIGDTDHLWKFHVSREFRGEDREEMETWRDMYLRCVDEREQKFKSVSASIQQSIKKSVPVRQTKLAYVDVAKPPRSVIRKQIKNGTSKPDNERLMGKGTAEAVVRPPPPKSVERFRPSPHFKPKVAPLMQKTLKSIKMARLKR